MGLGGYADWARSHDQLDLPPFSVLLQRYYPRGDDSYLRGTTGFAHYSQALFSETVAQTK